MKHVFALLSIFLLTACGDTQHAAYLITDGQHSLTLTRQQAFIGSDWDTEFVVARFPDCQRRYPLKELVGDKVKIDVYRTEPGVFILNSGKRWYVTETRTCRFEQFKEAPPAPGDVIGSFQVKDGTLEYKSQEAPAAVPPAPTSAPKQ
ncbi:hypothetical protein [Sulfuritalea hydrogenivorans]|uniref:Lipoprotein n=1 Tax=Sulfuritalea hydrogenivorans sk43H TaxID=1223802 RepID=W0SLM4_9PROT|nr:hypothetical protein [Sulfuritalea hydrogenivorans]BAO30683.1 hypothetical protein SUTH_02904 [Sulfuritalea hydrogenivorans sk43H]